MDVIMEFTMSLKHIMCKEVPMLSLSYLIAVNGFLFHGLT